MGRGLTTKVERAITGLKTQRDALLRQMGKAGLTAYRATLKNSGVPGFGAIKTPGRGHPRAGWSDASARPAVDCPRRSQWCSQ